MKFFDLKNFFLAVLILIFNFLLTSCTKEQRKDVKETIDTASQILVHDADSLINSKFENDSLFNSAPSDSVGAAGIPSGDFRSRLNDIFDDYEDIKDRLSRDDSAGVAEYIEDMHQALLNVDVNSAAEQLGRNWKLWVSQLEINISKLTVSKILKDQRKEFGYLTSSVENMLTLFGLKNKTVYKISCSGKNNELSWLTENKNFNNPYYGKDRSNERSNPCNDIVKKWEFK